MKKWVMLFALGIAMMVARPARAQGGCDDSPENPTVILAVLAGGGYGVSSLRSRLRAKSAALSKSVAK